MAADINTIFCTAQNLFGNGTTVLSTDWLDWKVAQDSAGGQAPVIEIIITTSFSGGTSATFQLIAVQADGSTGAVVLDTTPAIAVANLTAPTAGTGMTVGGTIVKLTLSPKFAVPTALLTHLRVQCVNAGNNTAGAATIHMQPDAASTGPSKAYVSGY